MAGKWFNSFRCLISTPFRIKCVEVVGQSLDDSMYNHVVNCKTAKHIWKTIEIIYEGTEEVRENHLEIPTSAYEAFKSNPGEGVSELKGI